MTRLRVLACIPMIVSLGFVSACGDDGEADTGSQGGSSGDSGSGGGSALGGGAGSGGSGGLAGTAGGSSGSSGSSGSAGSGGSSGACANDPGPEPNDSEALASPACGTPPCEAGDCDNQGSSGFGGPLAPTTGVIGPDETDFFKFDGLDELGLCQVNPTAETQQSGFRLCMFVSCNSGTNLPACKQGTLVKSPTDIPGCCTTGPGTVEAEHDCGSSLSDNDSAHVFLRVDEATACTSYTLDYHF